jgi:hypothetical protein
VYLSTSFCIERERAQAPDEHRAPHNMASRENMSRRTKKDNIRTKKLGTTGSYHPTDRACVGPRPNVWKDGAGASWSSSDREERVQMS